LARLATCKECNKKLLPEEKQTYSGRSYCNTCYTIKINEKQSYDNLLNIVLQCFNITTPSGLMLKQIKQYKEEFKYSYDGMVYSLWYCKEVKNIKFEAKYGLAILKYEYENAKDYFLQQQKIQQSVTYQEKKENIKTYQYRPNKPTFLIDINTLVEGE